MKRTLTAIGAAVIAVVGAVAASQAQSPQNPQAPGDGRGGGLEFVCGPERGPNDQRPPQGAMRGRGPGAGRQGGLGRPAGPGRMGGRGNPLCALDLTEDQQTNLVHRKAHQLHLQRLLQLFNRNPMAKILK
jgi:Spy/CpxP family protein refolding chaperone